MQNGAKVDHFYPFVMEGDLKEMLIRGFFLHLCKFSRAISLVMSKRCWGTSLRGIRSLTMDMMRLTKPILQENRLLVENTWICSYQTAVTTIDKGQA